MSLAGFSKKAVPSGAAFLFLAAALAGCATAERFGGSRQAVLEWSQPRGFAEAPAAPGRFQLLTLVRGGGSGSISIYIEGDGAAWPTPYQIKETVKDTVKAIIKDKIDEGKNKACDEAQKQLDIATKQAADAKAATIKAAETTKNNALAEADKLANKGGNPLEKAANKKLAEAARKKANDAYNNTVTTANNTEKAAVDKAKAEKDAKCK